MRPPRWIHKRQQLRVGGAFLPCFRLERRLLRWQKRLLHAAGDTGGVSSSAWGGHSSHVFVWSGAYFVGRGDIFTRRGFSRRDTGGVSSSAWGGAFLPCFRLERRPLRWQRRHLHAAGVFPPRHRRRQQLRVGGGIPPMFSSGAAPTSLAEATSSRGGLAEATSSRGGGFPAATAATSAAPRGGAFLPCFNLERRPLRWQRRHLHAAGVFPPRHRRRQQLRVEGAFLPCFHLELRLLRRLR